MKMRFSTRCLTLVLTIAVVVYVSFQLLEVSNQFRNTQGQKEKNIKDHAMNIMKRACPDTFPVPDSVRIFPDGREVHHIAFLKVHKAASGTATSIFFRYGMNHGLTFVLPKYLNIVSSTETLNDKAIHPRLNKSFDVITSHVIYNRKAFESYLHPDTVYIGIMREPYQQFKSSMNYMAPKYVYNISKTDPIQQYLKNPLKYEPQKNPRFSWINNRQPVEFGFPVEVIQTKNATGIDAYIKKLDKEFHLVIIAEYFDESIVLMRRMLNWKVQDILYRRLHIRGWDRKLTLPRPDDRRLFRKHASVDYALYDFFYKRLWDQAKRAGEDFFEEVAHFKQIRDEVDDFCKPYPNITQAYPVQKSRWHESFSVDKGLCKEIFQEEEDWVVKVGLKQYNIQPKPK